MPSARLRATTRGAVRTIEVTDERPATLGRSSAAGIAIDDSSMSRQHCRIAFEHGALVATDLGSSNGTWIGAQRIDRRELAPGDVLRLGTTDLLVEQIDGLAAEPTPPAAPEGKDLIGTVLGNYKILGILGTGGAAIVYRAEQLQLGREVALKVLRQGSQGVTAQQVEAFVREARSAARLNDPHLVQVYDVGADQGYHFLSMELVHGGSLARVLRAHGPLPWARAVPILRDIAAALQCTHDAGLVHRDVKPANILLTRSGGAKLADLGLAAGDTHAGTIAFIAPEQLRSAAVDARADLYALGCTAYAMLTGRQPFAGSRKEMADAHRATEPASFEHLGLVVPPALADLVLRRLMAKQPDERPASAAAVIERLDRIAEGTTSSTADTDSLPLIDDDAVAALPPDAIAEDEPPAPVAADPAALEPEAEWRPQPAPRTAREPRAAPDRSTETVQRLLVIAILIAVLGFLGLYFFAGPKPH